MKYSPVAAIGAEDIKLSDLKFKKSPYFLALAAPSILFALKFFARLATTEVYQPECLSPHSVQNCLWKNDGNEAQKFSAFL